MYMKRYYLILILLLLAPVQYLNANDISSYSPISHWTCDETSGVRYDSVTATGNDLVDNNTVGYTTGALGNACDFVASNSEYLSISDASQTGLESADFTLNYWLKAATSTYYYVIQKAWTTTHTSPYSSYISGTSGVPSLGQIYAGMISGGSAYGIIATSSPSTSVWTMITLRNNGTNYVSLSVNCTEEYGENKGATAYNDGPFQIGRLSNTSTYFQGQVDEVSYFDSYLSDSQLCEIYNSGTPLPYTSTSTATSTASTSTSTVDMTDTNFILGIILFVLFFLLLGILFSPISRKK